MIVFICLLVFLVGYGTGYLVKEKKESKFYDGWINGLRNQRDEALDELNKYKQKENK